MLCHGSRDETDAGLCSPQRVSIPCKHQISIVLYVEFCVPIALSIALLPQILRVRTIHDKLSGPGDTNLRHPIALRFGREEKLPLASAYFAEECEVTLLGHPEGVMAILGADTSADHQVFAGFDLIGVARHLCCLLFRISLPSILYV